ncbi:zinc finger BED domain-containing protein DAYSLEEPER-like protein [Tanacetum coccineum]
MCEEGHVNIENVVDVENNKEEKQKKPRATRKRCLVWSHNESYVNDQGEQKSKCRYCAKEYFSDAKFTETSTLRAHLKVFDQQSIRRELAYMLIVDELPFKLVKGKGFKHFLNASEPLFHTPKIIMARDCLKLYLEEKKKIGALLGETLKILMTMPFEEGTLRVKYLGVPLISSSLLYRDCKVLTEQLQSRVVDWRNKFLSFCRKTSTDHVCHFLCAYFIGPRFHSSCSYYPGP